MRVIDSLNLSTGVGLLALRAAGLRDQGASAAEAEKELQSCVAKLHTSFMIDTMEYIYKGGRCTAIQAIAGSVLKIQMYALHKPAALFPATVVRGRSGFCIL